MCRLRLQISTQQLELQKLLRWLLRAPCSSRVEKVMKAAALRQDREGVAAISRVSESDLQFILGRNQAPAPPTDAGMSFVITLLAAACVTCVTGAPSTTAQLIGQETMTAIRTLAFHTSHIHRNIEDVPHQPVDSKKAKAAALCRQAERRSVAGFRRRRLDDQAKRRQAAERLQRGEEMVRRLLSMFALLAMIDANRDKPVKLRAF